MFALVRLFFIAMIVLTVVYVCLSLYSRSVRRGKLNEWFDEKRAEDASVPEAAREDYIDEGLGNYDSSLRRKLILGVYIVPIMLVCVIIYVTNFM
jgi:hypothetical protein